MSQGIIIILVITLVLYFVYGLIIVPSMRQKKFKAQQDKVLEFQNGLKVSDNVLTMAGIYGVVSKIEKNIVSLKIAPNVEIKIDKSTIVATTKHKNI